MIFEMDRARKLLEVLDNLRYRNTIKLCDYRMKQTEDIFVDVNTLDTSDFLPMGKELIWGGHMQYFWFATEFTVPGNMHGESLFYRVRTGKEGEWDATNPQMACFVNGKLVQGLDVNHTEVLITHNAQEGETYRIILRAFTGTQNFVLKLDSDFTVLDHDTSKYYYDMLVLHETAKLLEDSHPDTRRMKNVINESLNYLDLRCTYSKEYYESLHKAQDYITKEYYQKSCKEGDIKVFCVGHTHLDCAWQWTLRVTKDKAVRSFATVLKLMEEYPDYTFMSSQPLLYEFVKEHAPEVYEQIRERVAEGRWETEGGMYVEADCNLASGESLVRQFLYGKRFFNKEFGKDNRILWLPDVFGYSAALPQILKQCGIHYFMTTKISWSEFNKMPMDTFMWEGIDGTRVLTHFVPTREYVKVIPEGSFETAHTTTYNGNIDANHLIGGWERYSQKELNQEILNCFGHGDGGGGPTRGMLEREKRYRRGLQQCPQTVPSTALSFFESLDQKVAGDKRLPRWVGELYLEYHRGTYTSMARNKRYNRKSEFLLANRELFASIGSIFKSHSYPKEELNEAWKVVLKNQFHDILPGSSIYEVYEESKEEYEALISEQTAKLYDQLDELANEVDAPLGSLVIYNANGVTGEGIVEWSNDGDLIDACEIGGHILQVQTTAQGNYLCYVKNVPTKGYTTLHLTNKPVANRMQLCISNHVMENEYVRLVFAPNGEFESIYDKQSKRELLQEHKNGNILMSYEDRPHNFDAWDLNNYYTEKAWPIDNLSSIDVIETGPVRGVVKIVRSYLSSTIIQYVQMYADSPRIDIKTEIDWREEHIFVKALFPIDIHTEEATYEIQYGNVTRKTHENTSWDFARFEVCMHKWMDVSEDGFGVSFLNDCKYGVSVRDGVVGLSLLKSATDPNPMADKEKHEFTYSIYTHDENYKKADTVRQAYLLNNPLVVSKKKKDGNSLPESMSFVSVDKKNVMIEVVKQAEDSETTIVRLYEHHNRREQVTMTLAKEMKHCYACDMLENIIDTYEIKNQQVVFTIKPFEIKTFLISQ